MFTQEELNNLAVFLQRVDLKGNESIAHATLLKKVIDLIQNSDTDKKPNK
jgi:hypothetical protein